MRLRPLLFPKFWDYRYIPLTEGGKVAKRYAMGERSKILNSHTIEAPRYSSKGKKKSRYRRFFSQPKPKWIVRGSKMEVNKLVVIDWYRPKTLQGVLAKKDTMFEREKILSGPARTNWQREHRRANLNCRLTNNLATRLRLAIKNNAKSSKSIELLGCSIESFKIYMESKFEPGMSWENYGPVWHIDHIMPCAIFDLSRPEHQRRCFHFSNLQPLFAMENFKKSSKYNTSHAPAF